MDNYQCRSYILYWTSDKQTEVAVDGKVRNMTSKVSTHYDTK